MTPCFIRSSFFYSNPVELNYSLFLISLGRCNGRCNVFNYLSTIVRVLSETKDVNVKLFNMITRINVAKTMVKHISWD